MGILDQIFGTELGLPARFVLAFVLILALIGVAVWLFRYFGAGTLARVGTARGRQPRLSVLEATAVDARRRLVLIRRDNVEHLMLVGGPTDVVVESNIVNATPFVEAPMKRAAPEPAARPVSRPPRSTGEIETETPLVPAPPQPSAPVAESASPSPPKPEPKPEPKGGSRAESQYADMAHRLEAALRRPIDTSMRAPTSPAHPSARAEPKIEPKEEPKVEAKPEPQRAEPRAAPTAPSTPPATPTPRTAEPTRPAPTQTPPAASRPASTPPAAPEPAPQAPAKRDVFANLEEEMANLLGRGGKTN